MSEKGRSAVESAKQLARAHRVQVLGWNDKPGKEFISLNGDGEKLQALRPEMERAGWHVWPVDSGQEGHFMDFGMQQPPARTPGAEGVIKELDVAAGSIPTSSHYRYRGPGGLYLNHLFAIAALLLLIWVARVKVFTVFEAVRFGLWFIALALALLPFEWVVVSGDESGLTVRKHFFGERKVLAFSDIKQAKVYQQQRYYIYAKTKSKRGATRFLTVHLKSGRSFDLFLPNKKMNELAEFIRIRIVT